MHAHTRSGSRHTPVRTGVAYQCDIDDPFYIIYLQRIKKGEGVHRQRLSICMLQAKGISSLRRYLSACCGTLYA